MALKFHSQHSLAFDLVYELEYGGNTLDRTDDEKLKAWIVSFGVPVHVEVVDRDWVDLSRCSATGMIRETMKVRVYERS